eukprot:gene2027-5100_t
MLSPGVLHARREWLLLQRNPLPGVELCDEDSSKITTCPKPKLMADDFEDCTCIQVDHPRWLSWQLFISGISNQDYGSAFFQLMLSFNEDSNLHTPQAQFKTIPYHPNIHPVSGFLRCPFLSRWETFSSEYNYPYIELVKHIQHILSFPDLETANHTAAANLYLLDRDAYHRFMKQCVEASLHVSRGNPPSLQTKQLNTDNLAPNLSTNRCSDDVSAEVKRVPAVISFSDYHAIWKKLGTTPSYDEEECIHPITNHPGLQNEQLLSSSVWPHPLSRQSGKGSFTSTDSNLDTNIPFTQNQERRVDSSRKVVVHRFCVSRASSRRRSSSFSSVLSCHLDNSLQGNKDVKFYQSVLDETSECVAIKTDGSSGGESQTRHSLTDSDADDLIHWAGALTPTYQLETDMEFCIDNNL